MTLSEILRVLILVCFIKLGIPDEHKCSDSVTNGIYKWKYRNTNYEVSEGELCWRNENELFLRKCDTESGRWQPEQVICAKKEKQQNKYCPEDLIEILSEEDDPLCIKMSKSPETFNESYCYGSNILLTELSKKKEISNIHNYFLEQGIHKIWLPLRRYNDNSFSAFSIRLPGKEWTEPWKDAHVIIPTEQDTLSNKHCLSLNYDFNDKDNKRKQFSLQLTHCDSKAHSVCIFRKHLISDSGCPKNFGALSYRPNECYGLQLYKNNSAEVPHQVTVAEYFSKRNMLNIILKQLEDGDNFFKVDDFLDENGSKYVVIMNKDEDIRIESEITKKFKMLARVAVNDTKDVDMILKMDTELNELLLVVYNRHYIWRISNDNNDYGITCFTNADYDEWESVKIKLIWEDKEQIKSIFKIKIVGDDPGEYWCEAHTIFGFKLVRTNKLIATKEHRGHVFAVRLKVNFNQLQIKATECHELHQKWKEFSKVLRRFLNDFKNSREQRELFGNLVIHNFRIMSVEECNTSYLRILAHVIVSVKASIGDRSQDASSERNSEEFYYSTRDDTTLQMYLRSLLVQLLMKRFPDGIESIRSIQFCFPESFKPENGGENQWNIARLNQTATSLKLCLEKNGLPVSRKCIGSFTEGLQWEKNKKRIFCYTQIVNQNITKTLFDLDKSKSAKKSPQKVVTQIKKILNDSKSSLIPADFFYMTNLISSLFASENYTTSAFPTETSNNFDIIKIYNYLMNVNEKIIRPAVVFNSTNILLDVFETFMNYVSVKDIIQLRSNSFTDTDPNVDETELTDEQSEQNNFDLLEYVDIGVILKVSSNVLIFTIDPSVANVSGVVIYRNTSASNERLDMDGCLHGSFKNEYYRFLQANHTFEDLLSEPNLQLGTFVPESLLRRLDEISIAMNNTIKDSPIVVIKIYSNDKLFQEENIENPAVDRIISISIPNRDSELPEYLPLALRGEPTNEAKCSYWNYKTWVSTGLTYLGRSKSNEGVVLCGCLHLTPFAYLIGGGYIHSVSSDIDVTTWIEHEKALDIITLVGSFLSLFGISGIFVTALIFRTWRRRGSSKILLHLSAAIAMQMVLFYFVNTKEYSLHLIQSDFISSCAAIGASLQYSVLVQFSWMAVIAYLQYKRYVQVFDYNRPTRFFAKSTLFAWGVPLIPVSIVVIAEGDSFSKSSICYPSGYALYFGLILPIALVILTNLIIFFIIIFSILREPSITIHQTEKKVIISQIRLSILLFFLLGFTWIFGLLAVMQIGIAFSYLFCLTATLQGFVIFVYFIILDPVTRHLWNSLLRNIFGNSKTSLSGNSTDLRQTSSN